MFYMVFVEGGNNPTYKHETYESAEKEARRLAERTGAEAYILTAFQKIRMVKFEKIDLHHNDQSLPF